MKIYLTLFLSWCCVFSLYSQEILPDHHNWYVQLKVGYGIPFNPTLLESPLPIFDFHDATFTNNTSVLNNGYGTLGNGLKTEFHIGRILSDHIAVDLGIRYSITGDVTLSEISSLSFSGSHVVHSQWMEVNPGIVLSTGFNNKFSLFSKIALSVPIFGTTTSNVTVDDQEGRIATYYLPVYEQQLGFPLTEAFTSQISTQLEVEAITKGGSSLGLRSSLGAAFQLSSRFKISIEGAIQTLAIRTVDVRYQDYTQSSSLAGAPLDIDVPIYIEQINFVDKLDENSNNSFYNNSFSIDEPQDELRIKPDFSNVAILIGGQYSF